MAYYRAYNVSNITMDVPETHNSRNRQFENRHEFQYVKWNKTTHNFDKCLFKMPRMLGQFTNSHHIFIGNHDPLGNKFFDMFKIYSYSK